MIEFLISVQVPNTHLDPIQISILYNEDGSVNSIDWRHAVDAHADDYIYPDEGLDYEEWPDEDSDEDPDYIPSETDSDSDYSE